MARRRQRLGAEFEEEVLAKMDRPPRRRAVYVTCPRCAGPARAVDVVHLEGCCPPCWMESSGSGDASHEKFQYLQERFVAECDLARERYQAEVRTEQEAADG